MSRPTFALLALLAVPLFATVALSQRGIGHSPSPQPPPSRPARGTGEATLPRHDLFRAVLPDSVLARVEFPDGAPAASVTLQGVREAAEKLRANADQLPAADRRQLVDMLVQQAVLSHRVAQTPPTWLHRDSTAYDAFRESVLLRVAFDTAMADLRGRFVARGDTVPSEKVLSVMVRDTGLATLSVVYDVAAVDSLTAAFLALPKDDSRLPTEKRKEILSALPKVNPADSVRVLGRCEAGTYTQGEFMRDLSAVGFLSRPTVRSSRDLYNLIDNKLYSRVLRRDADRQHAESRPDVAAALATRRQFLTVQRYVQNEAYDRVPLDTASVRAYFVKHVREYDIGGTADVVRGLYATEAQADSAARSLAAPGAAESLLTRTMPSGIGYSTVLGEFADTVLFARVRKGGVGTILGPDPTRDGWRVMKVLSLTARHPQPLADCFVRVRADWLDVDGDRRVRAMLAKLMTTCRVTVNERAPWLKAAPTH
jgi:hypothetical protein